MGIGGRGGRGRIGGRDARGGSAIKGGARFVGLLSPVQVGYRLDNCFHEGDCRKVCLVPHVLECVIKGRATAETMAIGADCTRCGLCVDVCPSGALHFEVKGMSQWL